MPDVSLMSFLISGTRRNEETNIAAGFIVRMRMGYYEFTCFRVAIRR